MLPLALFWPWMYIGALEPSPDAGPSSGMSSSTADAVIGTHPRRGSGSPLPKRRKSPSRRGGTGPWSADLIFSIAPAMTLSGMAKVVLKVQNPPPASTLPSVVDVGPTPIDVSLVIRPLKTVMPKSKSAGADCFFARYTRWGWK